MTSESTYIGQVFKNTYRLVRLIGEGGMGAVYEAAHHRLARNFAIKLLQKDVTEDSATLMRFKREAEITSAIGHPNILQVIDFDYTESGVPFIVMELLHGESLAQRLKRQKQMELKLTTSIFRQASSALQAAHQKGVVHRDLKPQNIFLCETPEGEDFVKIIDFGLSKALDSQSHLTQSRAFLGTPHYMAPEQAEERSAEVDLRTDIYAMGTILFEMLSGAPPFPASTIPMLLYKIVYETPPSLYALRPDLSPTLDKVIQRALKKKPTERFDSMDTFWREFAKVVKQHLGSFSDELPALGVQNRHDVPSGVTLPPETLVSQDDNDVNDTRKIVQGNVADPIQNAPIQTTKAKRRHLTKWLVLSLLGGVILSAAVWGLMDQPPNSPLVTPESRLNTISTPPKSLSHAKSSKIIHSPDLQRPNLGVVPAGLDASPQGALTARQGSDKSRKVTLPKSQHQGKTSSLPKALSPAQRTQGITSFKSQRPLKNDKASLMPPQKTKSSEKAAVQKPGADKISKVPLGEGIIDEY